MTAGSPQEQLMLELINRARMDPLAEAARLGIDLNQDLSPGTISATPKQVLAMSDALQTASDNHSNWMLVNDEFSHDEPAGFPSGRTGESPGDRMAAAGYVFSGSWSWGENISWTGSTGSIDLTAAIRSQHDGLFLSAGHRTNILGDDFEEAGIGQQYGQFTTPSNTYNASMVTQSYAYSGNKVFITGVVYNDTVNNDFYDVGEQVAGLNVADGGISDVTGAGGGYALEYTSGGVKTVSFGGVTVSVQLGSTNVKVDLVSGNQIWSNASITGVSSNVGQINALGIENINLTGGAGNQTITGNAGVNILRGGGGADTLRGLAGNDSYYVDSADDLIIELANQGTDTVSTSVSYGLAAAAVVEVLRTTSNSGTASLSLSGNGFDQTIIGNNGKNVLVGKGGNDILTGLGGADNFRFNAAFASNNIDRITDFNVVDDTIQLENAIFTALTTTGVLAASAFKDIAVAAKDANDRIIYNSANGALYYDADGSGSAFGNVRFGTLTGAPDLTAADFVVI